MQKQKNQRRKGASAQITKCASFFDFFAGTESSSSESVLSAAAKAISMMVSTLLTLARRFAKARFSRLDWASFTGKMGKVGDSSKEADIFGNLLRVLAQCKKF